MEDLFNWVTRTNPKRVLPGIDTHPILSKAQIKYENEMIMNADEPEELKPIINRWLVEYQNLTKSELAKFNPATQEALRAKYILARKMHETLKERAVRRKQGLPNPKLNKNLADFPETPERPKTRHSINCNVKQNEDRRELKVFVEKAFSVINNVEKRNNLLKEIFYENNKANKANSTTSSPTANRTTSNGDSHTMHVEPSTNSSSFSTTPLRRSSRRSTSPRVGNPQSTISMPIRKITGLPTIANGDIYTVIGPNGTRVPTKKFKALSFAAEGITIRKLLCLVFPEEILAKSTLSGKPSPAFVGRERPPKYPLNPEKVADIEYCVLSRIHTSKNTIRNVITNKCSDVSKKYRHLNNAPRQIDQNEE